MLSSKAWIKFSNGGPWSYKPIFRVESLEHSWRESVKVLWTTPFIASLIFLALDLVIGSSGTSNESWISWAIGWAPWFSSFPLSSKGFVLESASNKDKLETLKVEETRYSRGRSPYRHCRLSSPKSGMDHLLEGSTWTFDSQETCPYACAPKPNDQAGISHDAFLY